ncbi:MAG TPA: universal stress protein [Clostridiales bacterium]|nr:universal stress protein [Clostridiales bacterium]
MQKILVGLDGSKNAFKALAEGIRLARFYDAPLHTVSVEAILRFPETISEVMEEKDYEDSKYEKIIEQAQAVAAAEGCTLNPHLLLGHEVKAMIEFIREHDIDLLIIGFLGVSAIYERVMGSTCASLVRLAPCSVLVVK